MTQSDKIQNLTGYFALVRQRPGMFLGTNTISKLHDHLQGYQMAYWHNNFDNPIDKNFFENFNDFVYSYYGVTTNDNWRGVILEQCFNNEQTALATFFELYDLFINATKTTNTKKIVLTFLTNLCFSSKT
jgi:DNA gyrase/topoisomerase IV subunit B